MIGGPAEGHSNWIRKVIGRNKKKGSLKIVINLPHDINLLHQSSAMAICQAQAFVVLIRSKASGMSIHINHRYVMSIFFALLPNTYLPFGSPVFLILHNTSLDIHHIYIFVEDI